MSMITKRVLSLLLCFVMLVGMLPISALADDGGEGNQTGTASNVVTDQTQEGAGSQTDVKPASNEDLDENQGGSGDGQTSPEGGQTSPEGGQTSPEGGQTDPEGGQENPDVDQSNPVETPETPADGENQETPVEEIAEDDATFTINRNGETPLAVVYAASDFQPEDDETGVSEKGKKPMNKITDAMIKAGYAKGTDYAVTGALIVGDYSNYYDTWRDKVVSYNNAGLAAVAGILKTKWDLTSNLKELPNLESQNNAGDDVVYIQGNHDPANTAGLDSFGANDTDHYGVFAIHEDYFQWEQGEDGGDGNTGDSQEIAQNTAEALKTYLQGKVDAKDNRPIFVMSHVPLHFGWRTYASNKYGDNIYAKYLFDVLNEYGKQLNIIFLFGHNHSSTYDDYLGGAAIYLPADGQNKLRVPDLESTTDSAEYTLNFTYMNAGYLGYYGGEVYDSDDVDGNIYKGMSSTIFEIYDNEVYISRFDNNSLENLKNAGVKSSSDTWSGAAANTDTYASSQVITLKTFEEELSSPVKASGVMTKNKTAAVSVSGVYGKSYDVTWSSSNDAVATVTADEDPMQATITSKASGKVTITATITEVSNTRAVGDTKNLSMPLEVVDVAMVELAAAGEQTFYILDDNQDSSSWAAGTSKKYVLVSQDKGNPTAGEFMAMYANYQLDEKEGDIQGDAAWREINAEPITVIKLPIDGQTRYAVTTTDESYLWNFQSATTSYGGSHNWYLLVPEYNNGKYAVRLSRGDTESNLQDWDPDNDGIRLRGKPDNSGVDAGSVWRMSGESGLTAYRNTGNGYNFSICYDPIQGDMSAFYSDNGDEDMGKRIYVYEETTVTLTAPILAYMKDTSGSVSQGVGPDAGTGDVIYIQNGDETVTVPVTVGMLSKDNQAINTNATQSGLTVTYAGKTITDNYTLNVTEATTLLKNEGGKFRSTIYRLVDEMVGGRHYLIVDNAEAGEAHAMGVEGTAVSAHNVLIQSFKVGEETKLYINSARYSDDPDNPYSCIIENQGNVNANISSTDHKSAIRLVWTPTMIYSVENSSNAFTHYYSADTNYRLMNSEYCDMILSTSDGDVTSGDVLLNSSALNLVNTKPARARRSQWKYVDSSESDHMLRGITTTSNWVDNFSIYYSAEDYNSTAAYNLNFILEGDDTDYDPLRRRTWIYEQDDSIDTITARLSDDTGHVTAGCNASVHTDDFILVETYGTDGSRETVEVPVRVSMLSGDNLDTTSAGTYTGLTVTYEGKVIATNYTLEVSPFVPNDYPEFPQEGAVKIDKQLDTTQYNYLNTGAAVIDLSVTGIPAQSGVDILFVLDTSSSMSRCIHHIEQEDYCNRGCAKYIEAADSRLTLLKQTLVQTLKDLQAPINGYSPDVNVAVACFNGYTAINPKIHLNEAKAISGDTYASKANATQMTEERIDSSNISLDFTPVRSLTEGAMQAAADGLYMNAGTNYDRGMEIAYNMLKAKQERDALNGETRQQILVFMSDGIPYQFNYTMGTPWMIDWDNYLKGNTVTAVPADAGAKELFDLYKNPDETLWMAEAIKGDPNQKYDIINPDLQDSHTKIDSVNGLGATIYTVGMGMYKDQRVTPEAANLVLKNISSPRPEPLPDAEVEKGIADKHNYFYSCTHPSDFTNVFSEISDTVRSAGDAVFTDQMGDDFDLITYNQKTITKKDGSTVTVDYTPEIIVRQYPLYHRSDIGNTVDGVKVTSTMVGTRRSIGPTVIETVIFNDDGTAAYSTVVDKDGDKVFGAKKNEDGTYSIEDTDDNILIGGVICAKTFWYNTNQNDVLIDTDGDETAETTLQKESFYWNVGDIPQDELVLTYPVYLTGSMEGTRPGGTYDTNTHAELKYTNYLGNACELKVPTPKLPWDQATVGYGFYLVDKDGNPITHQTTGQTGSFEHSVKITTPVYKDFFLNSEGSSVIAERVSAGEVLPEGYVLFDTGATYEVSMDSAGKGYYNIGVGRTDGVQTTYVQGVAPNAVKGNGKVTKDNFATANTIVWFAVYATVQCVPDTVVIDYGLPVEIDVMKNDIMMGDYANLEYIGTTSHFTNGTTKLWQYLQNMGATQTAKFNSTEVEGTYGKAKVSKNTNDLNTKVRYTLNASNGMQMKEEETFVYAVNYTGTVGTNGYYYSTVTVIPATSIYYEDSFVTYSVFNNDGTPYLNVWEKVEDKKISANQAEDRPGEFSLSNIDANNIYGYDGAYKNMATYSMGSAQKITVNANRYAEAKFTFNGTGFDIISLTSNTTGTIVVSVKSNDPDNSTKKNYIVDTYYGYKYALCNVTYEYDIDENYPGENKGVWIKHVMGEVSADVTSETPAVKPTNPNEGDKVSGVEMTWIADNTAKDALYQVPVIKVKNLPYGNYTATITASYMGVLDHNKTEGSETSYDFYLDAIRIYDPADDGANSDVIEDAYVADGEGWPEYFELRNLIISKNDFNRLTQEQEGTVEKGIVFIDNTQDSEKKQSYTIEDYTNYGPNNELYLAPGQAVAFDLNVTDATLDQIHIAMKSVGNTAAKAKYFATGTTDAPVKLIETATDLYYDITDLNGKTVVIENAGGSNDAILSITNVKVTYKEAHTDDGIEKGFFQVTQQGAKEAVRTLMMMRRPAEPVEPEVPETIVPETTVPETTVPETTEPEEELRGFEPDRFEVSLSKDSVKVGSKVTVKVITSKDVEYITINGSKIAKYDSKTPKTKTWKVNVKAEEVGELDVAVVCYNKENQASEAVVNAITVKAPVFKPEKFTVSLSESSVKVGKKVTVTVTTSKDVEFITVNGSKIAKCSSQSKNAKTWKVKLAAEEVGKMKVSVVCYNKQDWASKAVVKKVTVKAPVFKPDKFTVSLSEKSVKAGSKVTVTVTTSKDVEYITVNGSKVTRYSGSRFSNTRTWQVRVNAKDVGEMDVTVVCYNRDKVASAPVVKTVTVTKKYTNIYNPMKDYFTGYFDKFWGRR